MTTLVLLALVGYFVYHAMQGKHGLHARVDLKKRIETLEKRLAVLREKRKKLDHYVQLMQSEKLDPDMLDEQARKLLNMAHPSDIIIMYPTSEK